jgi:hypothetical protein
MSMSLISQEKESSYTVLIFTVFHLGLTISFKINSIIIFIIIIT